MSEADNMQTFVPGGTEEADQMQTVVPNAASPAQMQTVVPGGADTVAGAPTAATDTPSGGNPILEKLNALSAAGAIDFDNLSKLGEGGMGLVCKAHQISLDREVALKVLKQELADKPQLVERFVREARAMAKINHPNVVQGYAVGEADGLHWVAMELIDGESMQDVLDRMNERGEQMSVQDAALATVVAAEALQHAHELKMIHRDIKPDNILVTTDGQIKVSDLGLAKATDEDMSMTQSGTGLGTPHYMPPEQARNAKHVDFRSDIYALGCTLYHFLVGGVPFSGESVVELIINKEKGQFPPVRKVRADVPERLALVAEKMMAAKPEHRYQTMEQVIADITKLGLVGETLTFIPQAAPVRRSGGSPSSATMSGGSSMPGSGMMSGPTMNEDRVAALAGGSKKKKPASGKSGDSKAWYLKIPSKDGKVRKLKAAHGEVLAKLRAGKLDPSRVKIASKPSGPYMTLAEVPAFSGELAKRQRRVKTEAASPGLASQFAAIDKQYGRRKFWRFLNKIKDAVLGLSGLVLYLGAIGIVGFLGYIYGWPLIQEKLNGGETAPTEAVAPEDPSQAAATPE